MDNVYRLAWAGCPAGVTAYVVDEPDYGTSLEQAIKPLIGNYAFRIWNTKTEFGVAPDFNDWRGDCVDIVAAFDKEGKLIKLDPGAVRRGMTQPEYKKNTWAYVPGILKDIIEKQDPEWAKKLESKWSA